jgi:hypothetical protein
MLECQSRNCRNFLYSPSEKKVSLVLLCFTKHYRDYCSPLWDICGTQLLDKLQKFKNRAARTIAAASYEIESAVVLETLG